MAFTMHSHSGQFCPGHAKDQLETIIQHAIQVGYQTIGLTEHMPRTRVEDLYPEELTPSPTESLALLAPRHKAYLATAFSLRRKYASQIHILIGFESEWIRPSCYLPLIRELAADPAVDYFIGSLHHVREIPIDFDREMYQQAVEKCGGTEEGLWERYLDEQWGMLEGTRPRVVGHFDLVRLFSTEVEVDGDDGGKTVGGIKKWKGVWEKVVRNLEVVKEYGGWLECNTSGLRKGLREAYPMGEIAREWVAMGGKFTVGDDSHGIGQVGTNYHRGLGYLEGLGVKEVWTLERREDGLVEKSVSLEEFRASLRLD